MRPSRPTRSQIHRRRRGAAAVLAAILAGVVYLVLASTVFAPVDTHGLELDQMTIRSRAMNRDLGVDVVVPPGRYQGPGRRPLLVFLHGRGGSSHSYTENEAMFGALARVGARAPIVAFPDGGDHGYWHDRAEGGWGTYVVDEVIPQVARRFGADPRRVAIGGSSMGGFGAYDLALLHPGRFCAAGGHSAALWLNGAETPEGAFDDAADFDRNDVIGMARRDPRALAGVRVWNDVGTEDPFLGADHAFDDALESAGVDLTRHTWPGGHEIGYWNRHWLAYFRFYADALRSCAEAKAARG